MRILFTSVGRRVELIQAYHKAAEQLGIELIIYGADMSSTAPAMYFCDRQEKVCRIKDSGYIPELIEICKREKIDALIPTIDTELILLSRNKAEFEKIGTKVIISDENKVRICRDKRITSDYFIRCGLKAPVPVDDYTKYNSGYPACIKPRDGSSSINTYKVNNADELKKYAEVVEGYIIQPFIEGVEYSVDVFCDFEGNPVYITPRERTEVRNGEVSKTRIEQNEIIIEECKNLIDNLKPCGAITVQLIRKKETGENYYIEINSRYGGGAPLSIMAGADSADACLRLLCGEKVDYQEKAADDGAVFSRFDQSVRVN